MSQSIKNTSGWQRGVIGAALNPYTLFSGMRYRMQGWKSRPAKALPLAVQAIFSGEYRDDGNFRSLSFTFSVIALSAKVACADGKLSREKYVAFRESFPLKGDMCGKIRSLFTLACSNETPTEHYVNQIKHMFPERRELFLSLVERLFHIATVDAALTRNAEKLLATIAHGFGIPAGEYSALCAHFGQPSAVDSKHAHHVMGLEAGVKANTLKKRYHELMKSYHPDRFAGQDLTPELQMLLQLKASEITTAYRTLAK